MATQPITPTPTLPEGTKEIRTRVKSVFDLDTKSEVSVYKTGTFKAVANMQEFVERLQNDSALVLQVVNEGLEEYAKRQLEQSADIPLMAVSEDANTPDAPFAGTALSEDKSAQLQATILNIAKMMFGYPDIPRGTKQTPEEQKANRELKASAKSQATDFILSNPAAIEKLKS